MNVVVALVTGILLVLSSSGRALAAPADCDAARCAIEAQIDAECPCDEAKNHGRYTACVKRVVNAAAKSGVIDRSCRSKINGCFIRSTCGKRDGVVLCQLPGGGSSSCRPILEETCSKRGGAIVDTCCESCVPPPVPTETPVETATPGLTATPAETATPEPTTTASPTLGPPTASPAPTSTPEETATPVETASPAAPTATPEETATPGEATATPGEATATPGEATATPGEATATPGEATATPGEATATPGEATATPGEATATPGEATATPGEATATPSEATATPGEATATPEPTLTPIPSETPLPSETPVATATTSPTATSTPPPGGCVPGTSTCPNAGNGLEVCSIEGTCLCPGHVSFTGNPSDPRTILDTGWNGIAHRAPVISDGTVTVALSNCTLGPTRPDCGQCTVSGPVPNTQPLQMNAQRCNGDPSIECTNAPGGTGGPCTGFGTCEFFFGSSLPLVAGGVGTCVLNQFNGQVSGTVNVESGEASTVANLISRVYAAISTDTPCPTCVGDVTRNDGDPQGKCVGGLHDGDDCDENGEVPSRPDYGETSLDCPPSLNGIIATLPIDLTNTTGQVSKAVTAGSPTCTGDATKKCVCDTCNTALAQPCDGNADCPLSGGVPGICGGRRCLGGGNDGGPCGGAGGGASACPGGGSCGRPGEPTKPNACVDSSAIEGNGALCIDTAPVGDNEGECPEGPPTGVCSQASGHSQRSCSGSTADAQCCDDPPNCVADPVVPGDCVITNRLCFLDNGLGGSIISEGEADVPMNDVANPTLAAVFCIAPTSAPAVNAAAGLPGPGRVTIGGTALGLP